MKDFPDYIDYLPPGCIVRKIGVMGRMPRPADETILFLSISRDEYACYVKRVVKLIIDCFSTHSLLA